MRHFRRNPPNVMGMDGKEENLHYIHKHRHYLSRTTKEFRSIFLGVIFHRHFSILGGCRASSLFVSFFLACQLMIDWSLIHCIF